ncbi:MAG TPA: winged helix-turn-helix domain-containing protein [Nitrosopumilaceae archaeon]|nr:winged helix-turn-helix domain-containing protein [Nitrosopumilaceae archaeon]
MKYRSRTEISAMILETARPGATKTKIMYKAYLSYTQVKEYISFLRDNDLLRYEKLTKQYRITEKGFKFLHSYDQILELLSFKNKEKKIVI